MPSLVLELQREALDPKVGVVDLLRKAFVVAVKLDLKQFKEWIEWELNGYDRADTTPSYRLVGGLVRVWNPYNDFVPFIIPDPDIADKVSHVWVNNPLSEIELFASQVDGESHVALDFPPKLKALLMSRMSGPIPLEPSLHVGKSCFSKVLGVIRDTILKWSLELEKDGILGEGMTFSTEEKRIATEKAGELAPQVNITIIGNMHDSSLQQGSPQARQNHDRRED